MLRRAVNVPVTQTMLETLAERLFGVIACTNDPQIVISNHQKIPSPGSPKAGSGRYLGGHIPSNLPTLYKFIMELVLRSKVTTGTLLTTIVFMDRLHDKLPPRARGMACTRHRIFFATLVITSKYLHDASPKNDYWQEYGRLFTLHELNVMERQLLSLLDYDLHVSEDDLMQRINLFQAPSSYYQPSLSPTLPSLSSSTSTLDSNYSMNMSNLPALRPRPRKLSFSRFFNRSKSKPTNPAQPSPKISPKDRFMQRFRTNGHVYPV